MKTSKRKTSKSARARAAGASLARERAHKPPQVQFEIRQRHKLRFVNIGANPATGFTWYNLLDTVIIAGGAATGFQLYDFVRLVEVEVWARLGGSATAVSVGVDFGGVVAGALASGKSYEDMSVSSAFPAYLRCRPDPKSQASQFQPASGTFAFYIRAPGAAANTCVVDVTLDFCNSNVNPPVAVAQAIAGATPGEVYFGGLDGLRLAGTQWYPQLGPNII